MSFFAPNLFKDQVAIVTGGTAGIGKAIAVQLACHGAKVAILGTNQERGEQVVEEIRQLTQEDRGQFYRVDVASYKEVHEAIELILQTFGTVHLLVNNAGITRDQLLMKMSEEDWDNVLNTNVKSCYNICHALVRSMMKARTGVILNISSVIGLTGNIGQANYAASKAAMIAFSKSLAKELAPRNIRVNCLCPGFIETGMTAGMTEVQQEAILEKIPLKCMGSPHDIANAALFLLSALAKYITGQAIVVDGGMVI
jgi:3-oxoacyl-[acyl-carrier protein] reductase